MCCVYVRVHQERVLAVAVKVAARWLLSSSSASVVFLSRLTGWQHWLFAVTRHVLVSCLHERCFRRACGLLICLSCSFVLSLCCFHLAHSSHSMHICPLSVAFAAMCLLKLSCNLLSVFVTMESWCSTWRDVGWCLTSQIVTAISAVFQHRSRCHNCTNTNTAK